MKINSIIGYRSSLLQDHIISVGAISGSRPNPLIIGYRSSLLQDHIASVGAISGSRPNPLYLGVRIGFEDLTQLFR